LVLVLWAVVGSAHSQELIADVLQRSQATRLAAFSEVDATDARAAVVQSSFDAVVQALQPRPAATLRVIRGAVLAETLHGSVVVANVSLAELTEAVRRFVLAHEIGHVVLGHWQQTSLLYQKWVPGAVTPQATDAVAALLGREASGQAHRHEFEADAFAARTLQAMGEPSPDMLPVFLQLGSFADSATHPGTRKRIAALRAQGLSP
jgi:hypothetical protein